MNHQLFRTGMITLFFCTVWTGCGEKKLPQGEATGRVFIDGEPLKSGVISLYEPNIGWGGEAPISDGIFKLSYSEAGLRTGTYQVAIQPALEQIVDEQGEVTANRETVSSIPKAARDYRTSGLTAEIKQGTNTLLFELSSQ